jgi:hypothetical protein
MSIAMYAKELADLVITEIMFCIDFNDLRILATLSTLNVLNTLTDLKADSAPPPLPMLNSMILRKTTVPSIIFIRLSIYFFGP